MPLSPDSDPLLTDRTTIETDWTCGMKRWWYKEEGGTGIVPTEEAVWFRQGRDYHADFAEIAEVLGDSPEIEHRAIELIDALMGKVKGSVDQSALEEITRRCGWIAANALYLEPRTRRDYRSLAVEHEIVLERAPLWVAVTPDRVLERIADNVIVYRDYKGVGGWGISKSWLDSWPFQIQLHTVLKAIEEELGRKVGFGQIIGLSKGQDRDGRLRHPYVWAYSNDARTDWETDYYIAKRKGLTPAPVWEYPEGVLEWVRRLGEEVADEQFSFSQPIFLNERLLADLIAARTRREKMVALVRKGAQLDRSRRVIWFEQRFSECRPSIGAPCPYLAACHNESVNRDPLGSGFYVKRTPHHELEIIGGKQNE